MTVPISKIDPGLGAGWSPGFQIPQDFINWILPRLLTPEEEAFLHASLRAAKQTINEAEQTRIALLLNRIHTYLTRYGWSNFSERDIADVLQRFPKPSEAVQVLTAGVEGPGDRQLSLDLTRSWLGEAGAYARNLQQQPSFRTYAAEARIDLGPVVADLAYDNPTDYPELQREALKRVRWISQETKAGMRDVLQDALRRGQNPLEVARDLRSLPGFALTRNQARAVRTYREALEEGRFGEAASRDLHDRRFGEPESQAAIDQMVDRYAERMATYRARMIARTEMMTAVVQGNRLTWEKLAETGDYEPGEIRRYWITAPENASSAALSGRAPSISPPCPLCSAVPLLNPEGVGMDEPFKTPEGPLLDPPLHVACRCLAFHRPDFLAVARRRIAALGPV